MLKCICLDNQADRGKQGMTKTNRGKLRMAKAINIFMAGLFLLALVPTQTFADDNSYAPPLACYNANGMRASHIIYKVSQWYGINPMVVLATLQKEQSLVTTSGLNQYGLDWAMGYAVPDSGNRDYSKMGFATQVDWASWQLKWNMDMANTNHAKVTPYFTGNTINIDGSNVYLANGATASLYRYTPHFHGNQNFRTLMNGWWPGSANGVWDPSNITSDATFGNYNSMTEQQIQDFLAANGSYLANYVYPIDTAIGPDSYRCPALNYTTVYRFWNTNGTHFYTGSEAEKNTIITKWPNIYKYEGIAYKVNNQNPANVNPLYRFYNKQNGTHFYTASEAEKNNIIARYGYIYQLDGVAYNVTTSGGTPVYRFWNANGTHFYTINESEKNNVIARWPNIYKYEGIAFYVGQ